MVPVSLGCSLRNGRNMGSRPVLSRLSRFAKCIDITIWRRIEVLFIDLSLLHGEVGNVSVMRCIVLVKYR